jgi:hypothetical protein
MNFYFACVSLLLIAPVAITARLSATNDGNHQQHHFDERHLQAAQQATSTQQNTAFGLCLSDDKCGPVFDALELIVTVKSTEAACATAIITATTTSDALVEGVACSRAKETATATATLADDATATAVASTTDKTTAVATATATGNSFAIAVATATVTALPGQKACATATATATLVGGGSDTFTDTVCVEANAKLDDLVTPATASTTVSATKGTPS